ncbi:MAG TPA: response regulator [Anaeromyxobacteraceae bacterium]|nr:response regulator [Anaeromyxobacteraceae bacterium]
MSKRVLIADDEPNIVMALEFLMQHGGYEVRTAGDGDEAVAALSDFHPDLVLLDLMMPKRNGYEVCQWIRATPALARTKVVMLTAKGRDVDVEKGFGVGADAYVTKPFATKDLVEKVRRLLGE